MMSFNCPGCGKGLNVKTELAGERCKCPHCKQLLLVPGRSPSPKNTPKVAAAGGSATLPPGSADPKADLPKAHALADLQDHALETGSAAVSANVTASIPTVTGYEILSELGR